MAPTGNQSSARAAPSANEATAPPAGGDKPDLDMLLPGDLLAEDERVIFALKPSLWLILLECGRITALLLVLGAAGAVLLRSFLSVAAAWVWLELCAALVVGRIGFGVLQWYSRSYVLTDRRVIRIRGVFFIDIFQCALPQVRNAFLSMSPVQRLLNVGSIALTTVNRQRVQAVWRHVRDPYAVQQKLLAALNRAGNPPQ